MRPRRSSIPPLLHRATCPICALGIASSITGAQVQAIDDDDEFIIHIADAGRLPAGHDFAENAGASRAQTFTSTGSVRITPSLTMLI